MTIVSIFTNYNYFAELNHNYKNNTNTYILSKGSKITIPFTTVKVIEGVFSRDKKAQLIEKITEGMIEVYGEDMRDKTWVVIEEVKPSDWAIGRQYP